ncbi:MAG: primosomal protein N' [Chromatiales bacterium]|nr:primosomal protein N' [Chromatiales bacterium]
MTDRPRLLAVAVPVPVHRTFDYLPPPTAAKPAQPGQRVRVPFGRSTRIGVITAVHNRPAAMPERLRAACEILDEAPLVPDDLRELLLFAARYYQHPVGEVFASALPGGLRTGGTAVAHRRVYRPAARLPDKTELASQLARAPLQAELMRRILAAPAGLGAEVLADAGRDFRRALRALEGRGLVEPIEQPVNDEPLAPGGQPKPGPPLNESQQAAARAILARPGFACHLLDGITGSGKTEVYLACMEQVIACGRQALVLVPEIALTPQLLARFRSRLGTAVVELHSGLADGERLRNWAAARDGRASVVIGTRSAVFAPLAAPGLLVVDEEHDASYKQHEGFRYSARDLAVWRGRQHGLPVVLGSATPSLESLENCRSGRYGRLVLPARAGGASSPRVRLVDLRSERQHGGLSLALREAMHRHLAADGQVLLYLNRRGFAPVLLCPGCGWVAGCRRCDSRMVVHHARGRLVCHHCGNEAALVQHCPECSGPLKPMGQGTERLEQVLAEEFPDWPAERIDRDTTRRRGELDRRLARVRSAEARILVGTQMVSKGHDFPRVTLVGVLDTDQGLFGTDFRSSERLAQALVQVAGRAGRADRPGEVLVQTCFPNHPLLHTLLASGYGRFAELALEERRAAGWPPSSSLCLLRAEARDRTATFGFLAQARTAANQPAGISLLGPAPAQMERRSGLYRGQLLLRAAERTTLQQFLPAWRDRLESLVGARRVRWSLDVDPLELA